MARGAQFSIFDEPEAGIDLWSFNSLITVFERLSKKLNGTLLIISHQERILNIAERIIIIANGQIKNDGSKNEVLSGILKQATCSQLLNKTDKEAK